MDDSFGFWFCGFIDGEGSFYISRKNNKSKPCGSYDNIFALALRADDVDILNVIKDKLGFGDIYYKEFPNPNSKPQFCYKVSNIRDCCKLVEIVDKYGLRTKKNKDYVVWKDCLLYRLNNYRRFSGADKLDREYQEYKKALENFFLNIRLVREFPRGVRGSKL